MSYLFEIEIGESSLVIEQKGRGGGGQCLKRISVVNAFIRETIKQKLAET